MAILSRCKCKAEAKLGVKICPGCGEPFPKKDRLYKVVLRANGRKVTRIVNTLELARELHAKLKIDILRGEHELQKKKPAPKIAEVWERYLPWAQANKKSWYQDYCNYEKHLKRVFANLALDKIKPFDIEKFTWNMQAGKSQLGRPYALATVKQQIVLLSHIFTLAAQWDMYEGANPCNRVRKPKLNNQKTEFMADEELTRLLKTLDRWPDTIAASIVRFALYTGMRRGEIFSLTWDDVNLERKTAMLRNPKGGVNQTIPLSNQAVEVLKIVQKMRRKKWIFYGKGGAQRKCVRGAWEEIRKAAELPSDFRFHGLRHHFASALVSSGVDLYTVQKLLTHKDAQTTQRYAHLADKTLRDAVAISEIVLNPKKKEIALNRKVKNA